MRKCALLRIQRGENVGYADLAPFPCLGDPSLENLFFSGHPLWKRALFWAGNPLSTWQCSPLASHTFFSSVTSAVEAFQKGFQGTSKIKCSAKDRSCWVEDLLEVSFLLKKKQLRIDCNESYSSCSFLPLITQLKKLAPYIEYIEDPFPFNEEKWKEVSQKIAIPFAKDHFVQEAIGSTQAAPYLIIKPAKQSWSVVKKAWKKGHRLIFSSYLGHPLERQQATWMASNYQKTTRSCYLQGLSNPADFLVYSKEISFLQENEWEKLSWEKLLC